MKKIFGVLLRAGFAVLIVLAFSGIRQAIADRRRPAPNPSPQASAQSVSGPFLQIDMKGDARLPTGVPFIDATPGGVNSVSAVKQAREAFAEALRTRQPSVIVRGFSPGWPEFCVMDYGSFWLKSYGCGTSFVTLEGESEKSMLYTYTFEYEELSDAQLREMKAEMDAAIASITAKIPAGADTWTCAKIIHDELAARVTYDETLSLPHIRDAYGALVKGEAVCAGYASAFSVIMGRLGNYCLYTVSEDHAWNHLALSSPEQYLDCTWDDPDLTDAYDRPYIFYDYFFLTREELEAQDSHVIANIDPSFHYTEADMIHANYHAHEGLLLSSGSAAGVESAFRRQFEAGSNVLTVRFADAAAWRDALALADNSGAEIGELLARIGYVGSYALNYEDGLRVLNVLLYYPS